MSVVPLEWHLTQSNGCFVDLHTWQGTNNNLSGYADYGGVHGTLVSGHIGPKGVSFTIDWHNGSEGYYQGTYNSSNETALGSTYDILHPASHATWNSSDFSLEYFLAG